MIIRNLELVHQKNEKMIVKESLYCLTFLYAMELTGTQTPSTYPAQSKFKQKKEFSILKTSSYHLLNIRVA